MTGERIPPNDTKKPKGHKKTTDKIVGGFSKHVILKIIFLKVHLFHTLLLRQAIQDQRLHLSAGSNNPKQG